jgi:5-methylcytosine-specific restriction enzyme subunit McrC
LLLVYASDLARFLDKVDVKAEDDAEIADILAKLLVEVVERRLRRSLSRAYIPRDAVLTRVRGRIDWLRTETGLLLQRGSVACRFEDHSHDTPRNRVVRAALEAMHARLGNRSLAHDCARLANVLHQTGVSAGRPSRAETSRDQIARHEDDDRLMVKVAELALDLVLPGEGVGDNRVSRLDRDERLLRRIFEKAVAGLYRHELHGRDGWRVSPQKSLQWQSELPSRGISALLPGMAADIVLQHGNGRRVVLDTKFTGILTARPHGGEALKSAHIYQLYAYLRSQAGRGDALADTAEGILLHPSINRDIDEAVTIQGHRFRFVTVDLSAPSAALREALLEVVIQNSGVPSSTAAASGPSLLVSRRQH